MSFRSPLLLLPLPQLSRLVPLAGVITLVVTACSASSAESTGMVAGGPDAAPEDSSVSDAFGSYDATAAEAGSTCAPANLSNFKVAWKKSTRFYQGVCSAADLETFRTSCLSPKDSVKCAQVPPACAACIATDESADVYGALILHHGWVELNVAGCVANAMDDPTGVKCAGAMQGLRSCELAACSANCPVSSADTLNELEACAKAADTSQCKNLADDATCAQGLADAGSAASQCFAGATFADAYRIIAGLFCLPSPAADAGDGG